MSKLEDIVDLDKIAALLGKKPEKKTSPWVWVGIGVAIAAIISFIGYLAYRYFSPDYIEDFEDDFDDEFDDDFFEDEENPEL